MVLVENLLAILVKNLFYGTALCIFKLLSLSLKREMRRVVLKDCGLDALTVALGFAYFETLVLRGAINKANREEAVARCQFIALLISIYCLFQIL